MQRSKDQLREVASFYYAARITGGFTHEFATGNVHPPAGSEAQNTAAVVQQSVSAPDDDRPLTRKEMRAEMDRWNLEQLKLRQKLEGRAKKAAANEAERLRDTGATVTPDQERQLYGVALSALNQDETTEAAPAMPGQSQPAGAQPNADDTPTTDHPLTLAGIAMLRALNLPTVSMNDEEAGMIERGDQEKYLDTLKEAARRKATRLANPPGTRIPSLGGGMGAESVASLTAELANMLQNWHGSPGEVKKSAELREKIQKLK